jgi:UDP-4-amino-4,6-dideoxy-N-acetyl-beta-L-altrosamine N-acetyltransferase
MLDACTVRSVAREDLSLILSGRNHPEVRRVMFTQHEISAEEHRSWFSKVSIDNSRCLLLVEEASKPIGYVQFTHVESEGVADWGFYTDPDAPKGTGRKLGVAALDHAFTNLKLRKVCGQVISNNSVSIQFHHRLGFIQEGVLRAHQRSNSEYLDLYCFGMLSQEWPAARISMGKK